MKLQEKFLKKKKYKGIIMEKEKELDATEKRLVERAKQLNSMTRLLDPEILRTYAGVMNEKVPESKYFERKEK